jgi:hypothetical protein
VKRLSGEPTDPNEPETHGMMICPLTLRDLPPKDEAAAQ